MAHTFLIRRVRFSATHRYRRPDWSEERNRRAFGSAVDAHGHDFEVEVVVGGPVDPETGFLVDLAALDEVLRAHVVDPLDQQDLTTAVPEFRSGGKLPTTENLAFWIWEELESRIPGTAVLDRVRVFESGDLGSEYRG